ncbi:class I SAM-dependent methyltransferase [Poseidonocella sp. HB161398]|uniref:class I SAM-dependent methyltransferase n=1 Tax=Poseidonocella sp. HB161398 TaxID=2320855 RepID=UPI001485D01F|nr:class I SAM-dependent methyltransferase [Poseidonocella sp. HB161398]
MAHFDVISPDMSAGPFGDEAAATPLYARRFSGKTGTWFLDRQAGILRDLLAPWPGASVLDIGGGHGQVVSALAGTGHHVTVASSLAREQTMLAGPSGPEGVSFVQCDLREPPFPDGSFDVVVAIRMMAHVEDWPGFLASMARMARKAVIIDFAEARSGNALADRLYKVKAAVETETRPFATQRRGEIEAVLEGLGLSAPRAFGQYVFPMALHRTLKAPGLSRGMERAADFAGLRRFGSPVLLRMERRA